MNLLQAIAFTLKRNNYSVATFSDGPSALAYGETLAACGKTIDLLIADLHLPDTTGMELINQFINRYRQVPVLALSGFGDKSIDTELQRENCIDRLDKPFTINELIRRVSLTFEKPFNNH